MAIAMRGKDVKEFEATYEKWRKMLLQTNIRIAFVVLIVESFMVFVIKGAHLMTQPLPVYLLDFLIAPTAADFLLLAAGRAAMKKVSPDSKIINYIPTVQLACICLVVASAHFIFSVTLCVFCVPLFTTVIFSDKTMTRRMGILCCFFLTIVLIHRKYSPYRLVHDSYFYEEAIVAFVVLIATIIICDVLIKFQEEKDNIIRQDYLIKLKMQDQLNKDPRTGLYGYAIFMHTLNQMVRRSVNTDKKIALAIIDIDSFKAVNDTYGHLKGDQVISALTDLMKSDDSAHRFLARYGGEEFAIIFSENEVENAFGYLEDLRRTFENQRYDFTGKTITVSIGLAVWQAGWTSEQLFNHADAAMYASKAKGRNKVVIDE